VDYLELSTDNPVEKNVTLGSEWSLRRGSEENQQVLAGPTELLMPHFIIT
jgi:hypothetical protein